MAKCHKMILASCQSFSIKIYGSVDHMLIDLLLLQALAFQTTQNCSCLFYAYFTFDNFIGEFCINIAS